MDLESDSLRVRAPPRPDALTRRAVLRGIREQVADELVHPVLVPFAERSPLALAVDQHTGVRSANLVGNGMDQFAQT